MHIMKVLGLGFALLGLMLFVARNLRIATPAKAARLFVPVWFVACAINMGIGVTQAGYTVLQEAPIFVLLYVPPVFAAWLVIRKSAG